MTRSRQAATGESDSGPALVHYRADRRCGPIIPRRHLRVLASTKPTNLFLFRVGE